MFPVVFLLSPEALADRIPHEVVGSVEDVAPNETAVDGR